MLVPDFHPWPASARQAVAGGRNRRGAVSGQIFRFSVAGRPAPSQDRVHGRSRSAGCYPRHRKNCVKVTLITLSGPLVNCVNYVCMQRKIEDCSSKAVAGGMCAKHYMRVRRTDDPTVRSKPGPKPAVLSAAKVSEIAALRLERAASRQEIAALR
jgi:hypothetical protein